MTIEGLRLPGLALEVIAPPFDWIVGALLHWLLGSNPEQVAEPLLKVLVPGPDLRSFLLDPGQPQNPARIENYCRPCAAAYASLRPLGVIALGVALLARMVSSMTRARDRGLAATHLLVDLGGRLLLGVVALQAGLPVLDFVSAAALVAAGVIALRLLPVVAGAGNPLLEIFNSLASPEAMGVGPADLLFLLLIAYLTVMVVISRAAVVLAMLSLPFAVPFLLYSSDGTLGGLWLRVLLLSCVVPLAAVICLAVAIVAVQAALQLGATFPLAPALFLLAAIWLTVKVMHALIGTLGKSAARGLIGMVRGLAAEPGAEALGGRRERSELRRAIDLGRKGLAVASLAAGGAVLRAPGLGENGAFELFSATQFLRHGISRTEGMDLSARDRHGWRNLFWAQYLAQEVGR